MVIRYEIDGSYDVSFGNNGLAEPFNPSGSEFAKSLKIKNDGKIIIGGYGYATSISGASFAICVLNPNGTKDASFGTNGLIRTDIIPGGSDFGDDLLLQPDEKILVAGHSYGNPFAMSMARYHPANLYNSVQENLNIQNIVVYPNPCNNTLHIDYNLNTDEQLSIYLESIMGAKVYDVLTPTIMYNGFYHQEFQIPTQLQMGLYYLIFEQQNGSRKSNPLLIKQ